MSVFIYIVHIFAIQMSYINTEQSLMRTLQIENILVYLKISNGTFVKESWKALVLIISFILSN
jgi:hypothetical protein